MKGAINTYTKEIRLEDCKVRSGETIKKFILKFIGEGNHIITDGWSAYNILDVMPWYTWENHTHGSGDFGIVFLSTSHIESL